ncbi:hypothetical protein [Mariniphaga sp.]|uniref:hypothetical protein n=1 Tax=Mariniphaga sp. TaxID=1954475 RepID=UPI00356523C5
MKQSASFSGNEVESVSLDFSELRERGLEYIQKLSGDVWTDYNSHDPGVTILEQLCYALTDIAYRTSLPVNDLLIPGEKLPVDAKRNAFFSPSAIFSSHPVTIQDYRKMIIDHFEEIQNVWITTKGDKGYQEELRGLNEVEILPRLSFLNIFKSDSERRDSFFNEVNTFLNENRNLGEKFVAAKILEPQFIQIEFDIHINENANLDETLAGVFLKLFEYVYCPVQSSSYTEMVEEEMSMEEIFAGPRLKRGFIKGEIPNKRLNVIQVDELQKLISKVEGINQCKVYCIDYEGNKLPKIFAGKGKFFHLLVDDDSESSAEKRFDSIYSNMNVFVKQKRHSSVNKQKINHLFLETWAKKFRGYSLEISGEDFFRKKLNGKSRNLSRYFSVQKHFPVIYGIGEEGISKNEPVERHAKANQLKAYLMLAEQHLANHLSQLGNLNEFFNIDFENGQQKTYFSQRLSSVPGVENLLAENELFPESEFEPEHVFYDRKNRIYDHLLARFGEDLNDIPWQISLRLNLIKTENEFHRIVLRQKSEFLKQLENLSYNRTKGESLFLQNEEDVVRNPSGLEQIILAKTGIPSTGKKSLIPDFGGLDSDLSKYKEEIFEVKKDLETAYRPLHTSEINTWKTKPATGNIPNAMFGEIGNKKLFKETLNVENYRLSKSESDSENVRVIFQREPNKWVSLFECSDEENAVQNIFEIIDFFAEKNNQSEGFYLVDHIQLNDFLVSGYYGFCFLDEYGNPLVQTSENESWCLTEAERNNRVAAFFRDGMSENSWHPEGGKWVFKNDKGLIIASIDSKAEYFSDLLKQVNGLIQLFDNSKETNGRLRLREVEKIRLKGSMEARNRNFGQRRLVFQRKLFSGEIVSEDFFDLQVSLLLPDWPARFQEERFREYVKDVFLERIPAHLSNEILWLNVNEMKSFEKKYHAWEKLKAGQQNFEEPSDSLKKAAFEVYQELMKLKQNRK